jgi:hypothetical protein
VRAAYGVIVHKMRDWKVAIHGPKLSQAGLVWPQVHGTCKSKTATWCLEGASMSYKEYRPERDKDPGDIR